jgi:hypothetical protein
MAAGEDGPAMPERDGEPSISGVVLLNNFRAFEQAVGAEAFAEAIRRLPPDVAEHYHALVPVAWMPTRVADQIFAAIADTAGQSLEVLFPAVIERGVEQTVKTIWRPLLRLFTDKAIISRTPRIFAKTYSRGRLTAEFPENADDEAGTRTAVLTLSDWPDPPQYRLLAIAAGVRAVLRVTGRKPISVEFRRRRDGARFEVRWRRR